MRMVIINKRPWAVGLDWSSTRMEKLSRSRLLEMAQKIDPAFDMMAVQRRLYGFGSSGGRPEDWKKARSLAAFIQLPPSFLGLFALEDVRGESFWWVIGRQNGQNVGQGDAVYATRQEAEQELKSLNELLDNSIAEVVTQEDPAHSLAWLEPLLHVGPGAVLRRRGCLESLQKAPGRVSPAVLGAGLALGLLIGGGLAFNAWREHQAEQASLESARLAKLNKEQRRQELLAHPENYFEQIWTQAPLAVDVAEPCMEALLAQPTVANGWMLSEASCAGRAVSVAWAHQSQADFLSLPAKAILKSPQLAVSRMTLATGRKARTGQNYPGILTRETATRHLYQITQQAGARLRLAFQKPEKRSIDKVELSAPWIKGEWTLSAVPGSLLQERALWRALSALPGLTLERISFKNEVWTLQGNIHARER